ncbi:MAG: hypothetical protein KBD44_01760 [Candidatus Pacebacteria bacterium]|jgi:hypothetical protein|nr:hypothetical protein [Candidatus Paceibacterota bacterium]
MSEEIKEPVLIWVESTSQEGVNVRGYINNFEGLHYLVTPQSAEVFERVKAQMVIEVLSKDPGLTFIIKPI